MTEESSYGDWPAVQSALKDAARRKAKQEGPVAGATTVDAQLRQARFDRFLSRVFADEEASEWLLKGGLSMLARVARARTTKDIDLSAARAVDLDEAERALSALVAEDLGDHLTFRLMRSLPTGAGENQPGTQTRRFVYACLDVDNDTHIDTVTVDVVVGPAPVGEPEIVEPANRLHPRRPLVTHPYRLFPVSDQIADKVCATMSTGYAGAKRSSRVKDLVDLVVLAQTQIVDLRELQAAIATNLAIRHLEPFDHFDAPSDWHRTYPATAKGVPLAEVHTAQTAAALVASFIDPALSTDPREGTWDPHNLEWRNRGSVVR